MKTEICMLATDWDGQKDLTGWLLSEKLDGVRGRWDGERFVTRYGNSINCPDWFKDGMPKGVVLDGEFWIKRNFFNETSGIIRRDRPRIGGAEWKPMRFYVFDAPSLEMPALQRISAIPALIAGAKYASAFEPFPAYNNDTVLTLLEYVLTKGGEGLMAIDPGASYLPGQRVRSLLKVKVWQEAEAVMVRRNTAKDSIVCKLPSGVEFDVGLPSPYDRAHPPKPGEPVTFRFFAYHDSGKPRHATYKGVRNYE